MKPEQRMLAAAACELRALPAEGEQPAKIVGYAAVFDQESEPLGGFVEVIAPGAFDDVLGADVRALFNHDANYLLGRTASGTLTLSVDAVGLRYERRRIPKPCATWCWPRWPAVICPVRLFRSVSPAVATAGTKTATAG